MDFFSIITAVYSSVDESTDVTSISICSDTLNLARAVLVLQEAKENGNSIAFDLSAGTATEEELKKEGMVYPTPTLIIYLMRFSHVFTTLFVMSVVVASLLYNAFMQGP